MRSFQQRVLGGLCLIIILTVTVSCAPAATPSADPTVAVVESTTPPLPTEAVEPTTPPPTEPPPATEPADPPTPTSEPEATEATEVDFSEGIAAYQANGCIGCHTLTIAEATGAVGPTHDDVGTTAEARITDPGYTGTATTTEEYIRESILSPTTYTVPGFTEGLMPSFATMDEAQLDAIVEMLVAQK